MAIKVKHGHSGVGVRIVKESRAEYDPEITMSLMDAARLLFELKAFLRADPLGAGCLDQVGAKRRREEVARCRATSS